MTLTYAELAPLGTLFSRRKEPYSSGTINNVISFVRNSPHIWSSKDPTTGMFVYRLKEETAKKIIETLQIVLKEKEVLQKQEELKQADREGMVRAFVEFFTTYVNDEGRPVFIDALRDLCEPADDHQSSEAQERAHWEARSG